ncbi:MAG TPA: DUF4440 domain-containing protein [Gemmatimonadota bacterium]|nr:DUF4440 domain-containing protein [Gemmatimonadota bacterium]
MRIGVAGIWLAALAAIAAACGEGAGDGAEERARAEIDSLGREWEEAANRAEVERLVEIYAPDAVILPPGGPVIQGSETIRELFRQEFERFDTRLAFTTQAIEIEGDMAYRRGRYVWRGTPRLSGQTVETANKFLEIWRRQPDGSWRIAVDMWNPAEPVPGGVGATTPEPRTDPSGLPAPPAD